MARNKHRDTLQIVYQNSMGYIGRCPCCEEIQFCIGNLVSFMPQDAFLKLYHSFQKLNEDINEQAHDKSSGKKVMVRTPVDNLLLSFSIKEFLQVIQLFDKMAIKIQLSDSLTRIENLN
ncbi:MAG: hypothetical protein MI974_33990 [Chitinophagales bacterium]|nr:hypothetical protein [Chitinophagales bacterium]